MVSIVSVNGKTYTGHSSISVINNKVIIDGKEVSNKEKGVIEVVIVGDALNVKSDVAVSIKGNVNGNIDAGSYVKCGNVGGSVDCGSYVSCEDVGGSVDAGSYINCKSHR